MHKVKVYSTPTCPWCMRAKQYLEAKGISYENVDVSSDEKAQEEMIRVSGQMGVPVIVVDDRVVVGFDRAKLDELLK
ncbi:MAG: glutathione S-transferase N-terminal domain-containing protein [Candidatus Omnitrophica bacterium]|nr:glutathione S-transferase N-terminal domain-containing protein [Candidatus Omnitrophota bacterium]